MKNQKVINFLVGIILLSLIFVIISILIRFLVYDFNGQLALGCLTFIGGICLAAWNFRKTKEKEAESRLFIEKAKVYQRLIDILKYFLFEDRNWYEKKSHDDLVKELADIKFQMIIWGGKNIIRAISNLDKIAPGLDVGETMLIMSDLYKEIRKDLGHKDDSVLPKDIVISLIKSEEKTLVMNKMILSEKLKNKKL